MTKKELQEYQRKYQSSEKRKAYRSTEEYKNKWKEYQKTDAYKKKQKEWHSVNKYSLNRKKVDHLYRLICLIRTNISNSLRGKGYTKKSRTCEILGCTFEEFQSHIEKQFTDGMSWDNYGEWEYDHIKQLSTGTTEDEIVLLNHYSNFQPLWMRENRQKNTRKMLKNDK